MINYLVGILLPVVITISYSKWHTEPVDCHLENDTFIEGEELVYKIYYNWKMIWIPAGEVKFSVKEDSSYFEYLAEGKTYSSYDNFFKVRDFYTSRVSKSSLFPESFIRKVEEGKYNRYDSILFDQETNTAISYWGRNAQQTKRFDFELDGCMQDMLSVLYFVRNHDYTDYKKGDQIPIKVFFDKETYPLEVTFDGREDGTKVKNMGKFKTLKFIPEVVAGYVFDKETTMQLWVSDDRNKIPLIVESPISIGSIKAVLKRYENLKYPLTSQVSNN